MVNFAEGLQDARHPEWRDYYVNYARLKGWLKEIEASRSAEAAQYFFDELTLSMERVETFYTRKEDEFLAWVQREIAACSVDVENGMDSVEKRQQVVEKLSIQIDRLLSYAEVNMEGLRKIAKKFDKTCGSGPTAAGSNYGRDTKGTRTDWGLAKDALQPRLKARFPDYRFGTSANRLAELREHLQLWKDTGTQESVSVNLGEPLLTRGATARRMSFHGVLQTPATLKSRQRYYELQQFANAHRRTAVYISLLTGVTVGCWVLSGCPAASAPPTTLRTTTPAAKPESAVSLDAAGYVVAWVTLITLYLLVQQWPSDCVMLGATLFLHISGLIDAKDAWGAFANEVVLSVAALSVVGDAVSHTGFIDIIFEKLIGDTQSLPMAMLRIYVPCTIGAFTISNTCVMACSMPAIEQWCKKSGYHVALFFMPVSFIMLIAGTFAIFSTSTNMVAQALLVAHDMPPLGQFELAVPALVCTMASLLYLIVATPLSLRRFIRTPEDDVSPTSWSRATGKSFHARMRVLWKLSDGTTIADSGLLSSIPGGMDSICGVERHGCMLHQSASEQSALNFDDIIAVEVSAEGIGELRRTPGLEMRPLDGSELYATMDPDSRELAEVILDQSSPLVGQPCVDAKTFQVYSGALIAIRVRAPTKQLVPSPDARLAVGDQLVLDVEAGFCNRMKDSPDFVMIRRVGKGTNDIDRYKAYSSGVILLVMLVFVATNTFSLFASALGAIFALVISGCATVDSVKKGIRMSVVLTIVGAFGIGHAISKHGIADVMASNLVSVFEPFGHTGLLVAVSAAVVALGVIFHGTAVVALMFPLCTQVASASGIPLHQMVALLCFSSALQMLSPVSYNTNLMAYAGCPEYEFKDFPKLGGPLVCIILVVAIPMCQWQFPA